MKTKIAALIIAVAMIFGLAEPAFLSALAEGNTINISSIDDFEKFAKKCTLDTYSRGKIVNLNCDIDFSGKKFVPIPTFGGTFNGNGHVVSGIECKEKGSYKGLFRYVQEDGKISNLKVKGSCIPQGSKSFVGGIAGENNGIIENCSFDGEVKGENVIGAIVGINTDTGKIISCVSYGKVSGENATGGIAGKNNGFIQNCTNNALVNTVYEEKKSTIADIDADSGAIIENYKTKKEESENNLLEHSDTGGVAGYSTGIVQGCINNASVGYKHIGYNVGGIAGRQSGYMIGCENYGFVQGRKDVGGIVGQAEPYVLLNASDGVIKNLRDELNKLNSMINAFCADADNLSDDAKRSLDNISKYAKVAREESEILVDTGTSFIDDNIAEINAWTAVLSNALDKSVNVFDALEAGSEDIASALDEIESALKELDIYAPELSKETDDITSALKKIAKSEKTVNKAVEKFKKAKKDLQDAIVFDSPEKVEKALADLAEAVDDIIYAKQSVREEIESIAEILSEKPENFEAIGINAKLIAEELKGIATNIVKEISASITVKKSLGTIIVNGNIDFASLKSAAKNMGDAMDYLLDSFDYITGGIGNLGDALSNFSYELMYYAEDLEEELNDLKEHLTNATNKLKYATEDIGDALGDMRDIIDDLSKEDAINFVKLGDDFKEASENLFDSLAFVSDEMKNLGDTLSDGGHTVSKDITDISNQFNIVINLLIDEFEDVTDAGNGLDDIFLDVSDENIENTKQGKIADCRNFAQVEADRNTGGIVGAMAIEYSKDPEDDIEKPTTLNFTYKSKAVLHSCVNEGEITGKKDCTGGIVGMAEIGTVYKCENYGDCESTNGNYVGGIAGKSDSTIRKSYAKSKVSGLRYVGGIAGKGDVVNTSYTIANVVGEENSGAILGDAKEKGNVYLNYFVDNGIGGIDSISYAEKAEPIDFDELKSFENVPSRFVSFTVKFVADGECVKTQNLRYGDDVIRIKYPPVPTKEGYFGKWSETDCDTITENLVIECEYSPYITLLASEEKNESGKLSVILCEGSFTDEAKICITQGVAKPPIAQDDRVKVCDVTILNSDIKDTDSVKMRVLNENYDKVTLWALKNGEWTKVKTSERGKYVSFEIKGASNTICLKYEKSHTVYVIIGLVVLAAVAAFAVIRRKRKKNMKN